MTAIPLQRIEGKYEILDKLREGGMGAIYKVRHRLLDEVRVIKLMRPQFTEDEELKARFLREARLAIKLRHPNIAQLYDFTIDEEDGTAFIVMEYIQGMTLEDILAVNGPPPLGLTLEIAQQSLKALGYLHSKGFVHRDISPDNLMLAEDMDGLPLMKLIDLGIAKILGAGNEGHLTQTGTFLGKVRYASPEQFGSEGAAEVDIRGDLYSFGLVLYELLTGCYPIQGRDPSSIIAGHLFRPPMAFEQSDPAGRVPPGLRDVVLKALAKQPDDRHGTALELSRALAVFRSAADFVDEDLRRILSLPPLGAGKIPPTVPGSTQERLNQQFGLETTPLPRRLEAVPAPVPAESTLRDPLQEIREREAEHQAQALAGAVERIEEALAGGHALQAETLLFEAEAGFGAQEAFAPLYERLESLRRKEVADKVAALVASARRLSAEGSFEEALAELQRARRLGAEDTEAASLLAEAEGELQRRTAIAESLAAARELVADDDFKGALKELRRTFKLDPTSPEIPALIAETEAAQKRRAEEKRRSEQIRKAVAGIEERLQHSDWDQAEKLLAKAVAAHPDDEEIEELEARLKRERRAAGMAELLVAAVTEIREHLDRGELDSAGQLLDRAVVRFGGAEVLREQWQRLEAARRSTVDGKLLAVLEEARRRLDAGDIEAALRETRRAAQIAPEDHRVLSVHGEVEAVRRRRDADARLAVLLHEARKRLDDGNPEAALKKLHDAERLDPGSTEVRSLTVRAEAARRQKDEERRRAGELAAVAPEPPPATEDDLEATWAAAQTIAELIAQRQADRALKALHDATARFGEREEFQSLRKRIADLVLE